MAATEGKKTRVYCSGVFDLFHIGHLRSLQKARSLGDYLIVGVHTDEEAASYKRQPVISFAHRKELVAAVHCVDEVITGPLYADAAFYRNLGIDVQCQGDDFGDYYAVAKQMGIIRFTGRTPEIDTTGIINRIKTRLGRADLG